MFGRSSVPKPRPRSIGNYFVLQLGLIGFSIAAAFFGGSWLYTNLPWLPQIIGQAFGSLDARLNDPFWVSGFLIYALVWFVITFIRAKTGSKI